MYTDLADLDGDDDLDLIAREWNIAVWFENPVCLADWTGDGTVDTRDFLAFLSTWTAHQRRSDIIGDGIVDTRDVLAFLNLWVKGCG